MATITVADIRALEFGYLNGNDLLEFCHEQILIKQEIVNEGALERHVRTAYSEINAALSSKCNILKEYEKEPPPIPQTDPVTAETRVYQIVKITTIAAIRNITAKLPDVPAQMAKNFEWLDRTLLAIRNGQIGVPEIAIQPTSDAYSSTTIVKSSFYTAS